MISNFYDLDDEQKQKAVNIATGEVTDKLGMLVVSQPTSDNPNRTIASDIGTLPADRILEFWDVNPSGAYIVAMILQDSELSVAFWEHVYQLAQSRTYRIQETTQPGSAENPIEL
jgi:hypothetical protein